MTSNVGRNEGKLSGFLNDIENAMSNGSGNCGFQNGVGARCVRVPIFLLSC